ncbi:MAG: hypothetical protein KC456_00570 [Flavobacteriales bacterium]|jgi:hypothetical protein|nr:hypothetical protein [Flavobacteriales bacterium]
MIKVLIGAAMLLISSSVMAQHSVVLKTGDKIEGVVMELMDDELTIYVNRQPKKIMLRDISSIFFDEYVPYDGSLKSETPIRKIKSADGGYMVEYQILDRNMIQAPRLSNATEKRGTVVVEVIVNRSGTVLKVKSGVTGSTTSDEYLLTKAEYACKGIKFNEYMKAPLETKGLITIHY